MAAPQPGAGGAADPQGRDEILALYLYLIKWPTARYVTAAPGAQTG